MLKVEKRTYGRMESLNQTPGFIARRGVWSGRRPGRASGKKRAYRPNGALSPDDRSRREKGGLEHEGWPSPVKWSTPGSHREKGGLEREKAGTSEWKEAGL